MNDLHPRLNLLPSDDELIRPRLEVILTLMLARAIKENCNTADNDSDSDTVSSCSSDLSSAFYTMPCWMTDQKVTIPAITNISSRPTDIIMDLVLRYGQRPNLDTNLVVMRKRSIRAHEDWGVLAAMCKSIIVPSLSYIY